MATIFFAESGYRVGVGMVLKSWKVESSKVLLEDRWIRLRADECKTSKGEIIVPYYVFDFPDWVTVFPVTKTNELILVRQYRHGIGEVLLELPGGAFETGEVDSVAVARRELREETGYSSDDFRHVASISRNPANHSNLSHIVVAKNLDQCGSQVLDYGEDLEVELMPLENVLSNLRNGSFIQAMHVAAIYYGLTDFGLL